MKMGMGVPVAATALTFVVVVELAFCPLPLSSHQLVALAGGDECASFTMRTP